MSHKYTGECESCGRHRNDLLDVDQIYGEAALCGTCRYRPTLWEQKRLAAREAAERRAEKMRRDPFAHSTH